MLKKTISQIKTAFSLVLCFTLLTGIFYPFAITGIARLICPWKANGSLIDHGNQTVGSLLIGQWFNGSEYFWSRPSATPSFPYNAIYSSGSNLGPMNPDLISNVKQRIMILQKADSKNTARVPVDLVTASASGLDPEISIASALYQIPRIAKHRKIREEDLKTLVFHLEKSPRFGILGEPRVNVLELNLALDGLEKKDA